VTSYSLVDVYELFGEIYCLYFQGRDVRLCLKYPAHRDWFATGILRFPGADYENYCPLE
jgi:hypothetical protein